MSYLIMSGCTQNLQREIKLIDYKMSFDKLKMEYRYCRGKGHLQYKDEFQGKLSFIFTVNGDSSYIQFRDWIGRQTLYLQMAENEIYAWDILNDKGYDASQVHNLFPFLKILDGTDLTKFFWGFDPQLDLRDYLTDVYSDLNNVKISFVTDPDRNPFEITKAIFQFDKNNQIEIVINERQYGMKYPGLKKNIPQNILFN